jgi:hypothetical protein
MKNATAARPPDTPNGDLKPQMPYSHTELTPGSKRETSSYENFPRLTTGQSAASCESHLKILKINPARTTKKHMKTTNKKMDDHFRKRAAANNGIRPSTYGITAGRLSRGHLGILLARALVFASRGHKLLANFTSPRNPNPNGNPAYPIRMLEFPSMFAGLKNFSCLGENSL